MSRAGSIVSVLRSDRIVRASLGLMLLAAPALGFIRPVGAEEPAASPGKLRIHEPRSVRTWSLGAEGAAASGLAYSRLHDRFFTLDASTSAGAPVTRVLAMDGYGDVLGTFELPVPMAESGDLVYDEAHRRLLLHDDGFATLYAIGLDAEGRPDPATLATVATPHVGPLRPAGMTVDPGTGHVFVLDRLTRRILRFNPESMGGDPSLVSKADLAWIPLGELAPRTLRGLAYDPLEEHLFVLEPDADVLYEVSLAGGLVTGFDLEGAGVRDSRGLTLAPSGDRTDEPSVLGLYVTGGSRITELALAAQEPLSMSAVLATAALVRTIDTSIWTDPSPDPSGLTYDAATGRLFLVDGEVEEESYWNDVNFYELSLTGAPLRGANLIAYSNEPVGVTRGPNRTVFVSDDDARAIFVIDMGPDRLVGTTDDTRIEIDTRAFGSGDPEGITYDPVGNRLFVADGVNSEVYVIAPGSNGAFDGVDDQVTHFDVDRLGVEDPECVEFHPTRGTLFIIGSGNHELIEMTTGGTLVGSWDLSFVDSDHAAGMAFAPGSATPTQLHLYVSYRGVDNDSNSRENDGLIHEFSLDGINDPPAPPSGGSGPTALQVRVNAGNNDAEESATLKVSLTGSDLELVLDSNLQTVGLRFPGIAIAPNAVIDSAFIQFVADESHNGATSLTIFGQDADNAPVFTSSTGNVSSRPRTTASVSWTPPAWTANQALRAQRTPDLAPILTRILSRGGWASGNAMAFVITGTGRRIAEAFEADPAKAPLLLVYVGTGTTPPPPPTGNVAPSVDAGPDRTILLSALASLDGTVDDDALPTGGTRTTTWSKESGPTTGIVTFTNANAIDTQAGFSEAGRYVLRLTASDGELSASDTMVVQVQAPGSVQATVERRVATGNDDAEQKNNSMSLDSSDLELVQDGSAAQQIGLRFTNLNLPPGAVVTNAWIQFKADEAQSGATTLTLRAQAADNAAIFSSTANVTSRPLTTATVTWTPPAWTSGQTTAAQRTPDLKNLLNELTQRATWTASSPVVIVITGAGHRTARAYEGEAAAAPLLHIEYTQ